MREEDRVGREGKEGRRKECEHRYGEGERGRWVRSRWGERKRGRKKGRKQPMLCVVD